MLAIVPILQGLTPPRAEFPLQFGYKGKRIRRKDLGKFRGQLSCYRDAFWQCCLHACDSNIRKRSVLRDRQIKYSPCVRGQSAHYFTPLGKRGCSSVVEHLLAKEDVASSSLVTR